MTKFLNISTDSTLGGNAPNDEVISSQKAIKEYIDSCGGYTPDLFDYKWADYMLSDMRWVRSDTFSWQPGATYSVAIGHLIADLNSGTLYAWKTMNGNSIYYTTSTLPAQGDPYYDADGIERGDIIGGNPPTYIIINTTNYYRSSTDDISHLIAQTETVAGTTITYYQAADGHKIVLADQESNVNSIYLTTGMSWYYILDETNNRFKLPRAKNFTGSVIGTGKALGLYDGTNNCGTYNSAGHPVDVSSGNIGKDVGTSTNAGTGLSSGKIIGVSTDPTKSGIIAERNTTDQYKHLYFYVGNFTQEAIENTAGLNASLFNGKADTDLGNVSAGIDFIVETQIPTSTNNYTWYRKYKSGWVVQGGIVLDSESGNYTVNLPITMADTNYDIQLTCKQDANGCFAYYMNQTPTSFVREATNRGGTTASRETKWRVEGIAA